MDTNVKLRYNGEITWDAPAITKSSCVVDVSYFPFDSQECNLTFGSWTYNGNQVFALSWPTFLIFLLSFYLCMFSNWICRLLGAVSDVVFFFIGP